MTAKNYLIATWDERTFTIDAGNAEQLIEQWSNADKPFPVDLGGEAISSSLIKSITPNHLTEADRPSAWATEAHQRIESGNARNCRAQYSIQLEINRIARYEHPNDWPKLIGDKAWRETMRQQLHDQSDEWCDDRTGDCACDAAYKPEFRPVLGGKR